MLNFSRTKDVGFYLPVLFICSVVAMMSPEDSWVAKWQRIGKDTCQNNCNEILSVMIYHGNQRKFRCSGKKCSFSCDIFYRIYRIVSSKTVGGFHVVKEPSWCPSILSYLPVTYLHITRCKTVKLSK